MALTNAQMQTIINTGQGVLYNGNVITAIADLPTDGQINASLGSLVNTIPAGKVQALGNGVTLPFYARLTVLGRFNVTGYAAVRHF